MKTMELTKEQKQDIQDKIERLRHLKEPYILVLQLSIPIFFAVFIFMIGNMYTQANSMLDVKYYNVTYTQNLSGNFSSFNQAIITPIKSLNLTNFQGFLTNAWVIIIFIYIIIIFLFYITFIYTKFDKEIARLYSELTGLDSPYEKKSNLKKNKK
jgi:hypothetical protein